MRFIEIPSFYNNNNNTDNKQIINLVCVIPRECFFR